MSEILYKYVKGKGWIPEDTQRGVSRDVWDVSPTDRYYQLVFLPRNKEDIHHVDGWLGWVPETSRIISLARGKAVIEKFKLELSDKIRDQGWRTMLVSIEYFEAHALQHPAKRYLRYIPYEVFA